MTGGGLNLRSRDLVKLVNFIWTAVLGTVSASSPPSGLRVQSVRMPTRVRTRTTAAYSGCRPFMWLAVTSGAGALTDKLLTEQVLPALTTPPLGA